mgnify:CR=1 FL=1
MPTAAIPAPGQSPRASQKAGGAGGGQAQCEPRAAQACVGGDVWWIDGCDRLQEVKEDCGARLCFDGACEADDSAACAEVPGGGHCQGDTARVCLGSKLVEVDCAARGKRCVIGYEGPECRPQPERPCDWPPGETRCEGDALLACVAGGIQEVDCTLQGGECGLLPGDEIFGCLEVEVRDEAPPPEDEESCGPCGCVSKPVQGPEVCDGLDNDGDGVVDNDVVCDAVNVVAFVVSDRSGYTSHTRADVEQELARVNSIHALGAHGYGLVFQLADFRVLEEEDLLEMDTAELNELLGLRLSVPGVESFYIPMIFTDQIIESGVPKAGIATLPNGACGGLRKGEQPQVPLGMIVLSKRRSPTTAAHEIGHFLGLCHTHESHFDSLHQVIAWPRGDGLEAVDCGQACRLEGDGICDTPYDPGPDHCSLDQLCQASCEDVEASPEAANVMSYYTPCRSVFSQEQALEMRRVAFLRRGWHPCVMNPQACTCQPGLPQCPTEMTCRPGALANGERTWQCGLDGARRPGQPCRGVADCGQGGVCMGVGNNPRRCVRPCVASSPGCSCVPLGGLEFEVCRQDLGIELPQNNEE